MTAIDERRDVEHQLKLYLARSIARGVLRTGEALSDVETLARELLVGPRRVAAAFAALEERGAIAADGEDWRVTPSGAAVARTLLLDELRAAAMELVSDTLHAGCAPADVATTLEAVLRASASPPSESEP